MNRKLWITSAAMAVFLVADGGAALAQSRRADGPEGPPPAIEWDKRRLQQLERNVRKLESQLHRQNRDPDAPPTIIEPDPEVVALQAQVLQMNDRLRDMEGTIRNLSGDLERATFELGHARDNQQVASQENGQLRTRIAELESRIAAIEAGAQNSGSEAAQGDPQVDFDAAMKLMNDQAYTEAGTAFAAFIEKWPDAELTPEAHYRLAESLYVRDEAALAAQSYARSLKGWPQTRWAAEATLKLATSLANTGRNAEACAALGEFNKRYASTSSANARNRANSIKVRAKCAA
jgi:tol-pal system protein YbgF